MRTDRDGDEIRADAGLIGAGRLVTRHVAGSRLWEQGDEAHDVVLLLCGRCRLVARTVFGDYTVLELRAPCLVGASEVLSGGTRFATLEVTEEGETVRLGRNEARVLLSARVPVAVAFRRLLILSATHAIRLINESLGDFFADSRHSIRGLDKNASGTYATVVLSHTADTDRVRELFDRWGFGLPLLSHLGLEERTYPDGARLTRTGELATEAFLTYSGRVRISIKIPGVGEEALSILGPGEIVGEMGLVDGSVRSAYAIAHEGPVTVFVMSRPVFRNLLKGDVDGSASLVARIATSLVQRLEETASRAVSFFVLSGGHGDQPPQAGFEAHEDIDGLLPKS